MGCGASRVISEQEYNKAVQETLVIALDHAIAKLGAADGFNKDEKLRIQFPPEIEKATDFVAKIPFVGSKVGEVEVAMNRAAENSMKDVRQFVVNAINKLQFNEAPNKGQAIVAGAPNAATEYLARSRATVYKECHAVISAEAEKVGAIKNFDDIMDKVPDAMKVDVVLIDHVVNKTVDGILSVMAEREKEVRRNPNLRSTALVAEVFAGTQ
jgi:hypothetical protein